MDYIPICELLTGDQLAFNFINLNNKLGKDMVYIDFNTYIDFQHLYYFGKT